jgi:hypothetical protein
MIALTTKYRTKQRICAKRGDGTMPGGKANSFNKALSALLM